MMGFHVRLQVTRKRKLLIAFIAAKRLGPGMSQHVILHIGQLSEPPIADLAPKRPCSIVGMHMAP